MATPETVIPEKLSHKKYRAALRKEKRKKRRQNMARLRDLAAPPEEEEEEVSTEEQLKEKLLELERQKLHEEWLLREEKAQEEFRIKKKKEEAARKQREEQERRIKLEWEEQQKKQREEEEQKLQEKREREEAVQKMLDQAENDGTWQNPEPPRELRLERSRASCPFYSKTGACRFGNRCSRKHDFPTSSPTLLVKSMFTTFGMEQCRRDDYDSDASLEYSEEETYQQFLDFYHDVLPEFKNVGKVIQFKVSCNLEPHLRGNVYVQYQSEEECQAALSLFNGRWYAGRQLQCEFCPVTRWKIAFVGYLKCKSVQKESTATFFMCSEIPTMNLEKLTETSTCLQLGLASLVKTQTRRRGRTTMRNTMARQGLPTLVHTTPPRETGSQRGRVLTGRNLTNRKQGVMRGTVQEEEEKRTTVQAHKARATDPEPG